MQLVNVQCACTPKWDIRCIHWKLLDVSNYLFRFGFVFAATHHTQVIATIECINLFAINSQTSAVVYVDFNLFLRTKYFKYVGAWFEAVNRLSISQQVSICTHIILTAASIPHVDFEILFTNTN